MELDEQVDKKNRMVWTIGAWDSIGRLVCVYRRVVVYHMAYLALVDMYVQCSLSKDIFNVGEIVNFFVKLIFHYC
jgi:hypothetical protein